MREEFLRNIILVIIWERLGEEEEGSLDLEEGCQKVEDDFDIDEDVMKLQQCFNVEEGSDLVYYMVEVD